MDPADPMQHDSEQKMLRLYLERQKSLVQHAEYQRHLQEGWHLDDAYGQDDGKGGYVFYVRFVRSTK